MIHNDLENHAVDFAGPAILVTIEECFEETHDVKMIDRNPATNSYPFMLAAAGKTSELRILYYLLCRNPIVLDSVVGQIDGSDSCVERKRQRIS